MWQYKHYRHHHLWFSMLCSVQTQPGHWSYSEAASLAQGVARITKDYLGWGRTTLNSVSVPARGGPTTPVMSLSRLFHLVWGQGPLTCQAQPLLYTWGQQLFAPQGWPLFPTWGHWPLTHLGPPFLLSMESNTSLTMVQLLSWHALLPQESRKHSAWQKLWFLHK